MVIALGSLVVMMMVVSLSIFGFGVVSNFFLNCLGPLYQGLRLFDPASP